MRLKVTMTGGTCSNFFLPPVSSSWFVFDVNWVYFVASQLFWILMNRTWGVCLRRMQSLERIGRYRCPKGSWIYTPLPGGELPVFNCCTWDLWLECWCQCRTPFSNRVPGTTWRRHPDTFYSTRKSPFVNWFPTALMPSTPFATPLVPTQANSRPSLKCAFASPQTKPAKSSPFVILVPVISGFWVWKLGVSTLGVDFYITHKIMHHWILRHWWRKETQRLE